jgi:hypothetical protein
MINFLKPNSRVKKVLYGLLIILFIWLIAQRPSHNRNWEVGQEKLPQIIFEDDNITINNFRNFLWKKDKEVEKIYETRKFKLSEINSVDVVISHFDKNEGLAHIFLSFGTSDGEHIIVSMETRRELGEEFSPLLGLLRQFEIIYVVGSERDVIGLRTDVREGERVYLYQTIASPEKSQQLFMKLAEEINSIFAKPKIYNTLTHNCTNEISRRVESISDLDFPLSWKTIMPGYFDEILYEMKIISHNKPFEEVKKEHLIDNTKVNYLDEDYSKQLREAIGK